MVRTLVFLSALALALPSRADGSGNRSPFEVDLRVDLSVTLACGVLSGAPLLFRDELDGPWSGLLDQFISEPEDGWSGYGKDTLVLLETLAANMAVNQVVKYAVRRPRPYAYDNTTPISERTSSEAAVSFYSAHTSNSFCMATAYSYLFTRRHPDSPWVVPVWLFTHSLAATTAGLRAAAGKHFWSDIIVGAVAGSGIGLLIPYLHQKSDRGPDPTGIEVSPLVLESGFGLAVGMDVK